jgi:sulfur-carrier protein
MVHVEFAAALQRHKACPAQEVVAGSLAGVLEQALAAAPGLKHYVLDDQGHIRKHVAVFINQTLHHKRQSLGIELKDGDRVLVVQSLTGG